METIDPRGVAKFDPMGITCTIYGDRFHEERNLNKNKHYGSVQLANTCDQTFDVIKLKSQPKTSEIQR